MTWDMRQPIAVIGGGFFGCAIALHLRRRGFERVTLIERERQLLERASYRNQARVHNGCHYPRSYTTALRSRVNLPRFCKDYGFAVNTDFTMLYAIAAKRSKVVPRQFERFMHDIGVRFRLAGFEHGSLFDPSAVAAVYAVEEYAFDACRLRDYFRQQLAEANVDVMLSTEAMHVAPCDHNDMLLISLRRSDTVSQLQAASAFNCTYANLNHVVGNGPGLTALKYEIAEVALVTPPPELAGVGVTVMDGPFFSCMPFPAEGCHSLTHVRYTPHDLLTGQDSGLDPVKAIDLYPRASRVHYMIADAARLMPCMRSAQWRRSLFEAKTILVRNELDDGRPVLLRREIMHPRLFSVLGAKIDNIYDLLSSLDALLESWNLPSNYRAMPFDAGGDDFIAWT